MREHLGPLLLNLPRHELDCWDGRHREVFEVENAHDLQGVGEFPVGEAHRVIAVPVSIEALGVPVVVVVVVLARNFGNRLLGSELRRAEVDIDRNFLNCDNYDECELGYRNFDNVISIGCKNTVALC